MIYVFTPKMISPDYLFKNTLGCLSGAQMGSNHEKNRGRNSRDTLPLRYFRIKQ